jgi:hypothetical protein
MVHNCLCNHSIATQFAADRAGHYRLPLTKSERNVGPIRSKQVHIRTCAVSRPVNFISRSCAVSRLTPAARRHGNHS